MSKQKCSKCKRELEINTFFYNGKTHKTCVVCSDTRRKNNLCFCKKKIPTFNFEGETKATHCGDCKLPDMVNVKSRKCISCKKKIPTFSFEGENKASHCADCKLPDMIDIKHMKCISCKKKRPTFNFEGENESIYCGDCKLPNMINVKSRKCDICSKRASYGIPLNHPTKCAFHKEENMISNPRARCRKPNCKNIAIYGSKNPIHCEEHKNGNDTNLMERKCLRCGRIDVLIDNICVNFCSLDDKAQDIKKHNKVKEKRILRLLTCNIKEPTEYNLKIYLDCKDISDKKGIIREEKEIGYDCKTHKVFIEVDERQHKSYCTLGEINRMKNIYHSEGGLPIIFIRYNPDPYLDIHGKKTTLPIGKREDLLIRWIKYFMEKEPEFHLSVKYLFYDSHTDGIGKYYEIDPYKSFYKKCCDEEFYIEGMYKEHENQSHIN